MADKENTKIATLSNDSLRTLMDRYKPQFARLLPKHLKSERFFQIALIGIQRTPRLLQCTPASLVGSLLTCSQLGLEPDGISGKAYLVPYWNSKAGRYICEVIPGYKGLMDLARRSGHVNRFQAFPVYEGDEFDYAYGFDQTLRYKPLARTRTNEKIIASFAMAYEDAEPKFYVSDREEIDLARHQSKTSNDGPWVQHFPAMAVKTAVRRFCKFLPQTHELASAVGLDELAESPVSQGMELLAPELTDDTAVEQDQRQEQERAKEGRPGGPYPSDVMRAAAAANWPADKTQKFLEDKFGKPAPKLEKGDECAAAIKAIEDAAKGEVKAEA